MNKGIIIQLLIGLVIGGILGAAMGYFGKCSTGGCPLTANPYRGALYGMFMGLLFAYTFGVRRVAPAGPESVALVHVESSAQFEQDVLAADCPVLVDFFSNSCPPCRRLSPIINELADEYKGRAVICKVDVTRVRELAQKYSIRGIPAVLFFAEGKEAARLIGLSPKAAYVGELDKLLPEEKKEIVKNASL